MADGHLTQLEISLKDRPGDPDLRDLVAQAGTSKAAVEAAQQRLADAEREHGFWRQLAAHYAGDRPSNILLLLRESGDLLHHLGQTKAAGLPLIERIQKTTEAKAKENARAFGRTFPQRVRSSDLAARFPIDTTSRHPVYTFANGFLRVDVDERALTASIHPRDGDRITIGLDAEYVADRVGVELRRLFDRPFDPEAFLKSVYTAYVAVLRSENRKDGDEIPLRRVSNRMAKNMNRFSADEFNLDLARIITEGRVDVDGRHLHLNHTRNARQGMLLHGLEEGGYVGFVRFQRD